MVGRYSTLAGGGRGGERCQGRTIFWLTRLELRLPRGITAPDLSAVPSFFTFCNTIALEPSLLHSLLDKKSFQAFQTDSGSDSIPSVREGVVGIKQTKWETCNEKDQAKTFPTLD